MSFAEQRLLGVIVEYYPNEQRGIVSNVETLADLPFYCQYVRSDVLRSKLAETNRFNERVFIQPNIYVAYTVCNSINGDVAGKIDPVGNISEDKDFGAPIIGYIQYFGSSNTGSEGLAGWINPQLSSDEQGSSWFDISKVIDPALKAHLRSIANLNKREWRDQEIKVRFWKANEGRSRPTAIRIALVDNTLRERWLKYYNIGEGDIRTWEVERDKYLSIPNTIKIPAYVEMSASRPSLGKQEMKMLDEFYKEAYNVTASNPAQRGQLDFLWRLVERRQSNKLVETISKLPSINGTKLAMICIAACRYIEHSYADSLEICFNAQRYDFAAKLAISMEAYSTAQRLEEIAMDEEPTEDRIQTLARTAIHTGNAVVFCDSFQEMLDACEYGEDATYECDLFTEAAIDLLANVGIDPDEMDASQICRAVKEKYSKPIPDVRELILKQRESEAVHVSEQQFMIPEDGLKEPVYYSANAATAKNVFAAETSQQEKASSPTELLETFKRRFMDNKSYRIPDRAKDNDAIPMIDELLEKDLSSIGDYRMPLLVRMCLDLNGSVQYIQQYIKRLENALDKKRNKYDKDRRWRLFKALLEYAQADEDKKRSDAWAMANKEVQGNDEPRLLSVLPH